MKSLFGESRTHNVSLVAVYDGKDLQTLLVLEDAQREMRQCGGSVAVDPAGEILFVSAQRANLVAFWDGRDGYCLTSADIRVGSGAAPTDQPGIFVLTGGEGGIQLV